MEEEKKIKNSPDYVSISGTQTILSQMKNSICKIKINNTNGTGFFCKIPYENKEMNVLMTNYHILDEKYYNQNDSLNLFINDEEEVKIINLKTKRITYFNKLYDLTLIELKESDGISINKYLELDNNLFKKEIKAYYENISIYVLQYPLGNNAAVSYGLSLSNEINNYEINHTCSTEYGSSGSPILNLSNNKVIGIHKQAAKKFNYNVGTCLQFPLNDFFEKNKKENEPNNNQNDILNKYLQNSGEFYERAKNYMNDMMNYIEHGQVMNIFFNGFVPGLFGNGYEEAPYLASNLVLKYGTTIDDMIKEYFKLKGRGDLINNYGFGIKFFLGKKELRLEDKTPIEIFFANSNPCLFAYFSDVNFFGKNYNNYNKLSIKEIDDTLLVIYFNQIYNEKINGIGMINENNNIKFKIDNDILNKYLKKREKFYERLKNKINEKKYRIGPGPKINVIFQLSGEKINLILNHGTTVEQMLKIYLKKIFGENNIKDELVFYYKERKIELGDKTPVGKYFGINQNNQDRTVFVFEYKGQIDRILYKFSEEEEHLIHLYGELLSEENIA